MLRSKPTSRAGPAGTIVSCAEEVLLGDAVFLVEQTEHRKFDAVGALVVLEWAAAEQNVQVFAGHALGEGLFHLVGRQMDQQIGHAEDWIALFFADANIHRGTVL